METTVTCSFLEIYNEAVSDLLSPGASSLALREDSKRGEGVFVENLLEQRVESGKRSRGDAHHSPGSQPASQSIAPP